MKTIFELRTTLVLVSFLLASSTVFGVPRPLAQDETETPRNVELTNAAWNAFRNRKYEDAIVAAERCIKRFRQEADRKQGELEREHAVPLPTGKVNKEQRKAIFEQGVLNDVATCYWIKGRSAQLLHRDAEARDAYNATRKYSYARSWDPKGWFWSPAEDASDRLQDVK